MKFALVTGGAKRLGKEICLHLARQKMHIVLHYYSSELEAQKTAGEAETYGVTCSLVKANLKTPELLTDYLTNNNIEIDLMIFSASLYKAGSIQQSSLDIYDEMYSVNLRSLIHLTKYMGSLNRPAAIIYFLDNKIHFNQNVYSAYLLFRKAAVDFMKMAALEFAPQLRINGIAPGVVLPMESRPSGYISWRVDGIPLKKQGALENLLQAVDFLKDNTFVTGQVITIDGGEHLNLTGRNSENYPGEKF